MLNNFLNSQIQHNINQINKLNHINNQKFKKKLPEKYRNIDFDKIKFFNKSNNKSIDFANIMNHLIDNPNEHFKNNKMGEIKLNNNITKINNVYKISFKNSPSSGFGDFIRGCYFLLEFCEENNINVDFHIYDSNIKLYLNYFINKPNVNDFIAVDIDRYTETNHLFTNENGIINYEVNNKNDNEFIKYLNNCKLYNNNNIFINTINFPSHIISKKHLGIMKKILEPTESLKDEVNSLVNNLQLGEKNFITYHIRLGDEYLSNQDSDIRISIFNKIMNKLNIHGTDTNYLLISDSVLIKKILKNKYPNIKIWSNTFSHTVNNNSIDIKNTLIDFYLMSYSKQIISFSVYPHGSGFSKWCSVTYEIPYICYSLL